MLVEGFRADGVDLEQPASVFATVFAGLPDEVIVYPSKNYYYFILDVQGREIWGNIRLAAGQREEGVPSFGYFEFIEFPTFGSQSLSGSRFFSEEDGVLVTERDPLTYTVEFKAKRVIFHLHPLDQTLPDALFLLPDERFVQRTFDESGYEFYLLFNEQDNYFIWVLNEERDVPDVLDAFGEELLIGRRSGFAFWEDSLGRKVLAGVRLLNVRRNDYYDGPFDQLADNYAEETGVSALMQLAFPALAGRIDQYGYYTDRDPPVRVALSTYRQYTATSDIIQFVEAVKDQPDPYAVISRGGRPPPAEADGAETDSDASGSPMPPEDATGS